MEIRESKKVQKLMEKLNILKSRADDAGNCKERNLGPNRHDSSTSAASSDRGEPVQTQEPNVETAAQSLCEQILSCQNYYSVLGLTKSATDEEIKKAYRKYVIRVHPDKCQDPKAEDAFKKVSAAYACLMDQKKRTYYDLYGEEPSNSLFQKKCEKSSKQSSTFKHHDIDPNEIYRMFFGPGGIEERYAKSQTQSAKTDTQKQKRKETLKRRHVEVTKPEKESVLTVAQIRQLLAVVFIMLFLLFLKPNQLLFYKSRSTLPPQRNQIRDHKFSFQPNWNYNKKLFSVNLNQAYFVSERALSDFSQSNDLKLKTDVRVEDEVVNKLKLKCSVAQY